MHSAMTRDEDFCSLSLRLSVEWNCPYDCDIISPLFIYFTNSARTPNNVTTYPLLQYPADRTNLWASATTGK
jgi:hypothetical protein